MSIEYRDEIRHREPPWGAIIALARKSPGHPGFAIVVDQADGMPGPTIALIEAIHKSPSLKFSGLQAYAGHLQHLSRWEYRKRRSGVTMQKASELELIMFTLHCSLFSI